MRLGHLDGKRLDVILPQPEILIARTWSVAVLPPRPNARFRSQGRLSTCNRLGNRRQLELKCSWSLTSDRGVSFTGYNAIYTTLSFAIACTQYGVRWDLPRYIVPLNTETRSGPSAGRDIPPVCVKLSNAGTQRHQRLCAKLIAWNARQGDDSCLERAHSPWMMRIPLCKAEALLTSSRLTLHASLLLSSFHERMLQLPKVRVDDRQRFFDLKHTESSIKPFLNSYLHNCPAFLCA